MMETTRNLRTLGVAGLAAIVLLLGGTTALAQDDRDRDRRGRDVQFGLGIGLVDPEDSQEAEIYGTASLRIRVGGKGDDRRDRGGDWEGDHYRGRPPGGAASSGIVGYLEPEVGYWSGGGDREDIEDLLVGVNLVGVVPTRTAAYYLGVGFGLHFFDATLTTAVGDVIESDEELLGGNLHVGVDVNIGKNTALFGTGRIDILEGDIAERQTKVYVGIRLAF